jgi:hypothetical protein
MIPDGKSTLGQHGVVMRSRRESAFGLFVCGAVLIGVSTSSIAFTPTAWADGPRRVLVFLGPAWLVGALLGARGWLQLREEKKHRPEQTWLQFLHTELVGTAVAIAALLGWFLMPEAWRDALTRAIHEVETALRVTRGGQP